MQLLEGELDAVGQIMDRINQDDRHTSIEVMYRGEIRQRSFDGWSMAFRSLDDLGVDWLAGEADLKSRASRAQSLLASLSESM